MVRTSLNSAGRKIAVGAVSAVFAASLMVPAIPQTAYADTAAEKQAEAQETLAQLNAMQESLDKASAAYGDALMAQQEAETNRDQASERIDDINDQISSLQSRMSDRARTMYREGNTSIIDALLGSATFTQFATNWDLLTKMSASDAEMVQEAKDLKAEAQEQESIYADQAAEAQQKAQEAADAEAQAQSTVAEMQNTYNSLSAEAQQLLQEERAAQEAAAAATAQQTVANSAAQAIATASAGTATGTASDGGATYSDNSGSSDNGGSYSDGGSSYSDNGGSSDNGGGSSYSGGGSSYSDSGSSSSSSSSGSYEGGTDVVSRAYACLGAPYVWGAVGPSSYDCSGLVSYCLTGSHTRLGTTTTFMGWTRVSDPQPGDVCTNSYHCGIYIGNGQMINAADYGIGVIISPVMSDMIIVRY